MTKSDKKEWLGQILKARDKSRDSLLEQGHKRTSKSKLTSNITYYPAFQNASISHVSILGIVFLAILTF